MALSEFTECSICRKMERTGSGQAQPYICSGCEENIEAEEREWQRADMLHDLRSDK